MHTIKQWAKAHVVLLCVIGVLLLGVLLYAHIFIVPKNISFSYATTKSCTALPTVLPAIPRTVTHGDFVVLPEDGWQVGGIWLFATKLCVRPIAAPQSGEAAVSFAPFGGWLFRQALSVTIPVVPTVHASGFDEAIPTTKKLAVALSTADSIYTYTLAVDQKTATCEARDGQSAVACDIPSLGLEQGKGYDLEVRRGFEHEAAKTVLKTTIHTLTAAAIIDGSVKSAETVYARPTEFVFTADKPLERAIVSVQTGSTKLRVATSVDGAKITAKLDGELEREKDYTLVIDGVEAVDGSTLTDPYKVDFHTSGGPKVKAVSVGHSGVARDATITVTFDQEISATQDVVALSSISGVSARIVRGPTSVSYVLQGAALCADFTLSLKKGIESSYGIVANDGWSYNSRVTCHTVSTYGYSVKGRALLAYNFGTSGPVTMYVGAIHGNESSSSGILEAWIDELEANPSLYSGKRVAVVPTINPDGLIANTRTNGREVNLNRNFPTDDWVKDINDTDGYHAGGGGAEPLSEPEARALASLTISLHPRLLLSYHAVGSLVTGDPGGYSAGYAANYASMVGYSNATGQNGTFDYDITGAYEDWTYAEQGIPSMVIELGSYSYYSFSHHRAAMRAMLN